MTRILVVEDEESFSDPLSYLLRKEGFRPPRVREDSFDPHKWLPESSADSTGACVVLLVVAVRGTE